MIDGSEITPEVLERFREELKRQIEMSKVAKVIPFQKPKPEEKT